MPAARRRLTACARRGRNHAMVMAWLGDHAVVMTIAWLGDHAMVMGRIVVAAVIAMLWS